MSISWSIKFVGIAAIGVACSRHSAQNLDRVAVLDQELAAELDGASGAANWAEIKTFMNGEFAPLFLGKDGVGGLLHGGLTFCLFVQMLPSTWSAADTDRLEKLGLNPTRVAAYLGGESPNCNEGCKAVSRLQMATHGCSDAPSAKIEEYVRLTKPPPISPTASNKPQTSRPHEGVDPDCYGDGLVCDKARVADAEAFDVVVGPMFTKMGWPAGCYKVRYLAGDTGGPNAMSVTVPAGCNGGKQASKALLTQLAIAVKDGVRGKPLARNVDVIQLTDGSGTEIRLPMSLKKPQN